MKEPQQLETRYGKQIKVHTLGVRAQEKLSLASCAIIGMGALGSAIADQLVRAGIGYLRIIDRDFVELSNLHRQTLYDEHDAEQFMPKAIAAAHKLRRINSTVNIDPVIADVHAANIEQLLDEVDIIIDGSDNFTVRYLINDYSVAHRKPWIYGAVVGTSGSSATFIPSLTPCFCCLFPEPPELGAVDTCDTAGVIGPIVQMIASIQATEALKLASGQQEHCNKQLIQLDSWTMQLMKLEIAQAQQATCACCGQGNYQWLKQPEEFSSTSLCGRETIQLTLAKPLSMTLEQLQEHFSRAYEVKVNRYLLKVKFSDQINVIFFPDNRIMIQGTEDVDYAATLTKKLVEI